MKDSKESKAGAILDAIGKWASENAKPKAAEPKKEKIKKLEPKDKTRKCANPCEDPDCPEHCVENPNPESHSDSKDKSIKED